MTPNRVKAFAARMSLSAINVFARVISLSSWRGQAKRRENERVERILVIELWNIGDVILAMPFLAQLRARFPGARLTLLARPWATELLAGTNLVDQVFAADLSWQEDRRYLLKWIDLWRVSRKLRQQQFDIAFSARMHLREHILLALCGAERKVGFSLGEGDGPLTYAIPFGVGERQRFKDWLLLLEPFGDAGTLETPRLQPTEAEIAWADEYLASRGVSPDECILIGIHPGASLPEKRWPLEQFREVAAAIGSQPEVRVLAFAEPSGYGSDLFAVPGVTGARVGLRELIALIDRCDLLVCNDSGPMHIAGALGVPTVALFGAGIEQWFAPLGEGHQMLRPDKLVTSADRAAHADSVREPTGISSSTVLSAVGRAAQRVRSNRRFPRADGNADTLSTTG